MNLANEGEGYVNIISGALFNRVSIEVRRELIRRGCIEAVIALPPLATAARVSTALICLRAPDTKIGQNVLMIDASDVLSRDDKEFKDARAKISALRQRFSVPKETPL